MQEFWSFSATDIAARVRAREVSALEITISALERMHSVNPIINAVVASCEDEAIACARALDSHCAKGHSPGPLAGVPVTVKVNIDQSGYATTNGLVLQKDRIATEDSPVVSNLRKAGAIIIGRTNTPAFSLRWFTRNRLHGATVNPANPTLTPGGSSGGAAAAVASGIGALAHGTDIAGSIRYPAYACGVHGLRPSLGRVAAYNASGPDRYIAGQLMAVSGPIGRTIEDLRLGLQAMAAPDFRDPWWMPVPLALPATNNKVALCVAPDNLEVDAAVEQALRHAAAILTDQGYQICEVRCPGFRDAARMNLALWMTEMQKSGTELVQQENDPDSCFVFAQLQRHSNENPAEDPSTIMRERATLTRKWQAFLTNYPLLLCPVSAKLPFADHLDVTSPASFDQVFEAQLLQLGLPFMGLPGLTVTTGRANDGPVGVQLIAGRFREDLLLNAGSVIEQTTGAAVVIDPLAAGHLTGSFNDS